MIWRRLKRLWEISGINVDGFEEDSQRKQIINKVTDILKPNPKEVSKNAAVFIQRHKENPLDKITKLGEETI